MSVASSLAVAIACAIAVAPAASAGVLVVDKNTGPYFDIQAAAAAANPGDTILVHAGLYATSFTITKAVDIVADPPGAAVQCTGMKITSVPTGGRVLIRGIDVIATNFGVQPAVYVDSCKSPVWLEDCELAGGQGFQFIQAQPGASGLVVYSIEPVVAVRCTMSGGRGQNFAPGGFGASDGGIGIYAGSTLSLYDCVIEGGIPGVGAAHGGSGIEFIPPAPTHPPSFLLSGCTVTGGLGVIGGDGLVNYLSGAQATVHLLDSTFTGGFGTTQNGTSMSLVSGAVPVVWADVARSLEVTTPVTQLAPLTIELRGVPGDVVFAFLALRGGSHAVGGAHGLLAVTFPVLGPFALTTITNPTGHESFTIPAPSLPPGVLAAAVMLDPVFVNGANPPVFGAPSACVLLQ